MSPFFLDSFFLVNQVLSHSLRSSIFLAFPISVFVVSGRYLSFQSSLSINVSSIGWEMLSPDADGVFEFFTALLTRGAGSLAIIAPDREEEEEEDEEEDDDEEVV